MDDTQDGPGYYFRCFLAAVAGLLIVVLFFLACAAGIGAFSRYQGRHNRNQDRSQALKDANNKVKVSGIEIKNQSQRVQVAKQQAEIRLQNAIGIKAAQDEIAKTLTPLYVQFEMTQALQEIAKSGRNSSVIYIPSGAAGVPLIANADPTQVTKP